MRVRYDGAIDAVQLPQLDDVVVHRGETVDLPDELAAQLIQQSCWTEEWVAVEQEAKARKKNGGD